MWSIAFDTENNDQALKNMRSKSSAPSLIFLFGNTDKLAKSSIPSALQSAFVNSKVIGCSTGTALSNGKLTNDAITGLAIGFDSSRVEVVSQAIENSKDGFAIGAKLGMQLRAPDLAFVYILSDGLNVNGSDIVGGVLSVLGGRISVSGGLAGDGARFARTILIENGQVVENKVMAIGFYGEKLKVAHGSDGGWAEHGEDWEITKSEGNVMYELDGQSAYEVYANILGSQAESLPSSGLLYPLRIWHPDYPNHDIVRTLLAVDKEKGTLTFAGDVPQNWRAGLMVGNTEKLVDGAKSAALKAVENFKAAHEKVSPNVCLMVSCVGRRLLLGDETQNELLEVSQNLPKNTNLSGFYSYGEIAPHKLTRLCSLHNQTVTLTLIGEER